MSTFIRMLVVMVTTNILEVTTFDTLLTRHKSIIKLWTLILARIVIQSYVYSFKTPFSNTGDINILRLTWVASAFYMLGLMYCWFDLYSNSQTSASKIFLAIIFSEITSGIIVTISVGGLNFLEGNHSGNVFNFVSPVHPLDFLYPIIIAGLLKVLPKEKMHEFYSNYTLRYPRIVFILSIIYFFGAIITDIKPLQINLALQHTTIIFAISAGLVTLGAYVKQIRRQRQLLMTTQTLVSNHYEAIRSRIEDLDEQRHSINQKMDTLLEKDFPDDLMQQYLSDMDALKADLYQFMYTHYYMIDALLVEKSRDYREQNLDFEVQCTGLNLRNISQFDVCRLLTALFHYIDTLHTTQVHMKISSYLNQLLIIVELSKKPSTYALKRILRKQNIKNITTSIDRSRIQMSLID